MKLVFLEAKTLGSDVDLSAFEQLGEVVVYPLSTVEKTKERIKDADIVIANKVPMNEETLMSAERLKLICLTATGTNNVDFAYVRERGIAVTNVKGYSTQSVVQHTFAMLFYLYEKLATYDRYVKSGEYATCDMFSYFNPIFTELAGKRWGIIGLGEIGRGVATVARQFGCEVCYYSTSGKNNNTEYMRLSLDELLKTSDIISIHAPLNEATLHLIRKEELEKMKSTAYLLNLGRGPIVEERALAEALKKGEIAGAGLDVLEVEPMTKNNPLHQIQDSERLFITPHIAWATKEARQRCVDEVAENIRAYQRGEKRNRIQ